MFGHAIGGSVRLSGLTRLGRHAMLVLVWVLLLIALALATWANLTSARAMDVQPALSNQNVSGR